MKFQNCSSVAAFEAETQKLGWITRRIPFPQYSAGSFILVSVKRPRTDTNVDAWYLFTKNEEIILDGTFGRASDIKPYTGMEGTCITLISVWKRWYTAKDWDRNGPEDQLTDADFLAAITGFLPFRAPSLPGIHQRRHRFRASISGIQPQECKRISFPYC